MTVDQLRIERSHSEQIDKWIAERHYLESTPPGAKLRLWVFERNKIIGAMMWGRPCARNVDQEKMLELTRMVFLNDTDDFVESRGLGLARKYIRKHMPQIKGLLAYASTGQGHDGIVYKADNWFPFGKTGGGKWKRTNRTRANRDNSPKIRWLRTP